MFSLLPVLESDFAKKKRSDRPSNTALPKRDAPISLGSLQDALCSTMCKVLCAMQYSYSHFILNRVTTVFSVANPLFPICVLDISSEPSLCNGTEWRWLHGVVGALGHSDALMHCAVGGELVLGCALRLNHWGVPCADALMRSLVDDELNWRLYCDLHCTHPDCLMCFLL